MSLNNTDGSIEHKITKSGILKLNSRLIPIGIFRLTAKDKSLTKKPENFIKFSTHQLREVVECLALEIKDYLQGPRNYKSLENVMNYFENEFISFLDEWDFRPADLNPYSADLVKKAKKSIKKNLSQHENAMTRFDKKPTLRRKKMVENIHGIFEQYTKFSATDINHYIAHLLIECGVETGTHISVFNKIDRQHYRYKTQPAKDLA